MRLILLINALLAAGCNLTIGPGPEGPPTPVECRAHVWGDEDGDGIGYRLPTTSVHVDNTSGYPLDVAALGGSSLRYSPTEGAFKVPMVRVNEPGNGWLGLAQVWVRGDGTIHRALVKMNAGYPDMLDPAVATHVGCMEVLHTAGLAHQEGSNSCMNDCSKAPNWGACMRSPEAQTPDAHDWEQMAELYGRAEPPDVCVGAELTLLTFTFPAPGEGHDHE